MNIRRLKKELLIFGAVVSVILTARSIFLEPFRIPTGSMIPTLMIGDFILVNKMEYGLKVPFVEYFSDPIYIKEFDRPRRGDVIVFKFPSDPQLSYIKRIVGVPGDTVEIRNKVVYLNEQPLKTEEFDGKDIMYDMDQQYKYYKFNFFQAHTGGHTHVIQQNDDNYYKIDFDKVTVPSESYFVLGDNRDFSSDSRFWGFVPFKNIKGRAFLVWFSMIIPLRDEKFKIRPYRMGTMVDEISYPEEIMKRREKLGPISH